jgi:protein SCO1/2
MKPAPLPTVAAMTIAGAALLGCDAADRPRPPAAGAAVDAVDPAVARDRLRGVVLTPPQPKPDFNLTTTEGKRFDFRRETDGYLTLLFFGYTHCPDVCPVHMANLGRVIKQLPIDAGQRIRVVFVTTDPERDTPERLETWLGGFHRDFIGLTGTPEEIRQAQLAARLMPAARETPDSANPSSYTISHGAQVIAFTPDDGLAHIIYPFGIRQQDWANDLPILVKGWPR